MKEKCKIYLVQDDLFYSYIFKQNLINLGYRDISSFSTIAECLNHLDESPDIIFYDNDVDILKGEEIVKLIKRFYPNILIVFSCLPEERDAIPRSLNYGAFDYFIKGNDEAENVRSILANIHYIKPPFKKRALYSL